MEFKVLAPCFSALTPLVNVSLFATKALDPLDKACVPSFKPFVPSVNTVVPSYNVLVPEYKASDPSATPLTPAT